MISQAEEKYPKRLFTRKQNGSRPVLIQAEDERAQSRFVCQKVLELWEEGVALHDLAVLFRSGYLSFDLEIELTRHNIPYVKRGGFKFMEAAHVKDILAHLRVLVNPRDVVSWNRLLLLIDGIGPRTGQSVIRAVTDTLAHPGHFLEGLKPFCKGFQYSAGVQELFGLLERISEGDLSPSEQMGWVCQYYIPLLQHRYDDYPKRMRDLEHLQAIADRYRETAVLLADLALEPPEGTVTDLTGSDGEKEQLILSTIHSAKGLEWHSVFLIWALDGRLPSMHSLLSDEEVEEERRLFYVALTRAKENIFVTYPIRIFDRSSGTILSRPSRFIEDIDEDLLETWTLVEEG